MAQQHRTLQELKLIRERKLHELQELGYEPFPHFYEQTHHAAEIQAYEDADFPSEEISVAGRVVSLRRMGKASFAHLQDQSGRQQIYVKKDEVGEKVYEEMFRRIDLGDYLGCRGEVFRTRTGEITVKAREVTLLAKSLRPLPNLKEKDGEVFDPFEDKENRYRRRYLDLIANPEVKDVFIKRAEIIKNVRSYLDKQAFLEVETPALQPIYGGASARPFTTHHHALDQTLYLRIADELYLKRLIIGGFERVYEIAKNFRNEGMDKSHNPEFTSLEFYMAYVDYKYLMAFTENMIKTVATSVGVTKARFMGHDIDLTKPFAHARMFDLLKEHTGEDLSSITDVADLYKFAKGRKLEVPKGLNYGQLLNKIFGAVVEPHLIQPIFVIDHPRAISPLAKLHRDGNKLIVERFELFIGGCEFANAFTELNDPIEQRQRLESQAELREAGDDEAQVVDEDFIEAMEFGMPPTGGVGVGIDRLVMLLTNQDTIKDVILFPAMRPQK